MSYLNRPYGGEYYESQSQVVREGPYGGYEADYRVDEYGNRIHRHHNGVGNVIAEVIPGGHHHHHHGRPAEIIERSEERIVDNAYDPYRRVY